MQLSQRLKAVADTVTIGNRVADVGCDHAYISIYLIKNKIAPNVIAMDVNKGPLQRAKENIYNHGFNHCIQTRLSDGLQKLEPGEADTILIAGMGGALVIKILDEGFEAVEKSTELILQPQSEIHLVRKYLHRNGYDIKKEQMIKEDGKYYFILKAFPVPAKTDYKREVFYQYGKLLLEQREPLMMEYLEREYRIREDVKTELLLNPTEKSMERLGQVKQEIAYIEEALTYFK
ncbi:tRNA (adenine(22)-N(1))-methyltransferase [Anaerocolumna sp. MB42-C2]|uniref:tRNA (adenine(22)-N(1))-methyltransferase n=1 Tax=Anaerocolumna sp. MB42-C2 TaxID=3070997 RepID=UPI0027E087BE|nr:class I SAM-dependent methyltransferase [Anaerocolumna sp. MB42-C2]WMJ89828.1 class I SAM-dependent methyltransferase [Anaerocolumna sp. MB42-C2]